jgi:putative membrane protein
MATTPTSVPPPTSATNGTPTGPVIGTGGAPRVTRTSTGTHARRAPRSRAGALWVGICVAAFVLVALIVFILQNTEPVLVSFLGMEGSVPLAVALLIAGVGVGIVALIVGTVRIAQLRRRVRHGAEGPSGGATGA